MYVEFSVNYVCNGIIGILMMTMIIVILLLIINFTFKKFFSYAVKQCLAIGDPWTCDIGSPRCKRYILVRYYNSGPVLRSRDVGIFS